MARSKFNCPTVDPRDIEASRREARKEVFEAVREKLGHFAGAALLICAIVATGVKWERDTSAPQRSTVVAQASAPSPDPQ